MKKVYYLCYYAQNDNIDNRKIVLSATNKIDYIVDTITSAGVYVHLISASYSTNKNYTKGKTVKAEKKEIKYFNSFGWRGRISKSLTRFFVRLELLIYLLKLTKDDSLIVYHSMSYMRVVSLAKKIKKFKLILELEEIYGDVIGKQKAVNDELRFCRIADCYIFPSKLLDDMINVDKKPSIIVHGTYRVEKDLNCKFDEEIFQTDGLRTIHCVYAGTFDPRKGGAIAAAAAEFLPKKYHIHILGFGSESDVEKMKDTIDEIAKKAQATITYDGLLSGTKYTEFIQNCHIGLSTQNPNAAFNSTSFPSKILSYMSNGLRVVSIRIPAIEESSIGSYMYYYDNQTPEEIAKAIMEVDMSDAYDGRGIISDLDEQFKADIIKLL